MAIDWGALGFPSGSPAAAELEEEETEAGPEPEGDGGGLRLTRAQRDVAKTLLLETREELVRADGKASLLLAALGVALGTILAVLFTGGQRIDVIGDLWKAFWWLGFAFSALGTSFLCAAVYPRAAKGKAQGPPTYYGHIVSLADEAELVRALADTDADRRMLAHLMVISQIVHRKYTLIRWAMYAIGVSIFLCLLAVLAGGTHTVATG